VKVSDSFKPTITATRTPTATGTLPTATATPTVTPNPTDACGYLASLGAETAPIMEGMSDETTYIYTSSANSGRKDFTVLVPSSGAYKMSAAVSALDRNHDSWNVEILGVLDTNNVGKDAFCVISIGTVFHTEDVNRTNGAGSTRYWNLAAGQYIVSWYGRESGCALACFNQVKASDSFMATVTPMPTVTSTPTVTPSTTEDMGGEGAFQSSMLDNRVTSTPTWDGKVVKAAPNVSRGGEAIQFRFMLEQAGPVQLALYSIAGERVYVKEIQGISGMNLFDWNLRNRSGSQVASGLYLYRAHVGGRIYSGKIAVIH
jgi:hypothetical protein